MKLSFVVDGAASRHKRKQSVRQDERLIFVSGGGPSVREKPVPKKVARAKPPRSGASEAPKVGNSPSPARGYSSEEVLAKRAKEWVDGRRNDRWQTCVRIVFKRGECGAPSRGTTCRQLGNPRYIPRRRPVCAHDCSRHGAYDCPFHKRAVGVSRKERKSANKKGTQTYLYFCRWVKVGVTFPTTFPPLRFWNIWCIFAVSRFFGGEWSHIFAVTHFSISLMLVTLFVCGHRTSVHFVQCVRDSVHFVPKKFVGEYTSQHPALLFCIGSASPPLLSSSSMRRIISAFRLPRSHVS